MTNDDILFIASIITEDPNEFDLEPDERHLMQAYRQHLGQQDKTKCLSCDEPITPEESLKFDNLCWACANEPTKPEFEQNSDRRDERDTLDRRINSAEMLTWRQRAKKGLTSSG